MYSEGPWDKLEEEVRTGEYVDWCQNCNTYDQFSNQGSPQQWTFAVLEVPQYIEGAMSVSQQGGPLASLQEICALVIPLGCGICWSGLAAAHAEYTRQAKVSLKCC